MENLIPKNFIESFAALMFGVALIFSFISLVENKRTHSFRVSAVVIVGSLAIFANHWATYFAAIFIIATAVTELEFLQNLAAIIRGDKHYFDYKTQQLDKNDVVEKARNDIRLSLPTDDVKVATSRVNEAVRIEELTLTKLESFYKNKISRNIKLLREGLQVELDGLIKRGKKEEDTIIEVKILHSMDGIKRFLYFVPHIIEEQHSRYTEITGRDANVLLVVVVHDLREIPPEFLEQIQSSVARLDITASVMWFTYAQIGFDR